MARAEAIYRDDVWSLQVFKAATVFLKEAERYGLADDMFCCDGAPRRGTPRRCALSAVTTMLLSRGIDPWLLINASGPNVRFRGVRSTGQCNTASVSRSYPMHRP
jgi:hypothetical protein